jgi:hypothetical protein
LRVAGHDLRQTREVALRGIQVSDPLGGEADEIEAEGDTKESEDVSELFHIESFH